MSHMPKVKNNVLCVIGCAINCPVRSTCGSLWCWVIWLIYWSSGTWLVLKPVQSHTHGGISDVLKGVCVGSKIPPLYNMVVMPNVLDRWMNVNNIQVHQYASVKMRVKLEDFMTVISWEWSDKSRDELYSTCRGRTPSRERGPQDPTKILQKIYTCLETILLKLTRMLWMLDFHSSFSQLCWGRWL